MSNDITIKEKLACITRELGMRADVYPRWVEAGKMTATFAARQIEVMRAIREDYMEQALAAEMQLSLFKTDPVVSLPPHPSQQVPADIGGCNPSPLGSSPGSTPG